MPTARVPPGTLLRHWRERQKPTLPQSRLASMLHISPAMLQRIEAGFRSPSEKIAMRIEILAGVPVERWGYNDLRELARKLSAA